MYFSTIQLYAEKNEKNNPSPSELGWPSGKTLPIRTGVTIRVKKQQKSLPIRTGVTIREQRLLREQRAGNPTRTPPPNEGKHYTQEAEPRQAEPSRAESRAEPSWAEPSINGVF